VSSGWEISPYCGNSGCVEILRQIDGSVLIRDSKDPTGPFLTFSAAEWEAHVDGITADLRRKNTTLGLRAANFEYLLDKAKTQIAWFLKTTGQDGVETSEQA
jgi:hypothetical protein